MNVTATVDRIEGDKATLLLGPEEVPVAFPLSCLPEIHEGSVLDLQISLEPKQELDREQQVRDLLLRLTTKSKQI